MKKLFLIVLILLICSPVATGTLFIRRGAASYCDGTLFCFEEGDYSWTTTPGAEDCDGYDADGDWCDQETAIIKNGTYSLGVRGESTNYLGVTLAAPIDDFHIEFWIYPTDTSAATVIAGYDDTSGEYTFSLYIGTADMELYLDNGSRSHNATGNTLSVDTWTKVGMYYKVSSAPATSDGIAKLWIDDDHDGIFQGDECYLNDESEDTGANYATDSVRLRGPSAGNLNYYDDVRIIEGAPSWPTS